MPHPTTHAVCLASSGKSLSGIYSGFPAFTTGSKGCPALRDALLSGVKARFGALVRCIRRLLPLPERGTLLHFEAGDGGFLEAFHAARPDWELSAIESGDAFMRLLKKDFLRSAYNADYRDADIVARFDLITVTKPLDAVEKPLNAIRWLSRRLEDNGALFLWQPALRPGAGLSLRGLPIRIANLTSLCKAAGLSVDTITTEGNAVCLCARNAARR